MPHYKSNLLASERNSYGLALALFLLLSSWCCRFPESSTVIIFESLYELSSAMGSCNESFDCTDSIPTATISVLPDIVGIGVSNFSLVVMLQKVLT